MTCIWSFLEQNKPSNLFMMTWGRSREILLKERQIMEFIVDKRKDLSFIGPEFSAIFKGDEKILIHVKL